MIDISFPKPPELPREINCLTMHPPAWDDATMSAMAERLGVRAKAQDLGLWTLFDDDRTTLEIFGASDSFRIARRHGDEITDASETVLDPEMIEPIATRWAEAFAPSSAAMQRRSMTDCEVFVATTPGEEPRRFVAGVQTAFTFAVEGIALLGPGAKLAVTVGPDAEIDGGYRFWRDHSAGPEARLIGADEVFSRFAESRFFEGLEPGGATAEVTSASWGYLCIPPTETQRAALPVMELRGVLRTELNPRYEFTVYANLVHELAENRRARVLNSLPSLVTI